MDTRGGDPKCPKLRYLFLFTPSLLLYQLNVNDFLPLPFICTVSNTDSWIKNLVAVAL